MIEISVIFLISSQNKGGLLQCNLLHSGMQAQLAERFTARSANTEITNSFRGSRTLKFILNFVLDDKTIIGFGDLSDIEIYSVSPR